MVASYRRANHYTTCLPKYAYTCNEHCDAYSDLLDWPRLSYREEFKEGDEEADRETMGRQHLRVDWALNGISYHGKLRTARSGGSWL